jgi:hypothetical protein
MAVAVQRSAIAASCQRLTLRQTRRTVPFVFSMMLVQASERRSSTGRPRRVWIYAENVGYQSLSLRQLSFANPLQPCVSAQISFCFKGVCRKRPNLRDWQDGDFRSLNGFRLFPSEPRRIWFGQRKRNVSSRLPIRVDRTFHRSSAARHSIRDTRSGRGAVCRCARLRMRQSLNGASARHC